MVCNEDLWPEMWIRCDKIEGVRFYQTFLETLDGSKQRMVFGKRNPLCQLKPKDHLGCAYNELLIHAPPQVHNWAGSAASPKWQRFQFPNRVIISSSPKQSKSLYYHTILHDTILRVSGGLFIFWVDATLADFVLGAPLSRLFRLELPIDLS